MNLSDIRNVKYSKRERVTALVVFLFITSIVITIFVYAINIFPRVSDLIAIGNSEEIINELNSKATKINNERINLQKSIAEKKIRPESDKKSINAVNIVLSELREKGLELDDVEELESNADENYKTVMLKIKANCNFRNLISYLSYLNSLGTPVSIKELILSTNDDVISTISCELTLTIFCEQYE